MAGSLNKVQLIGHLGADPEIRSSNGGDPIANMRIATSESWKDKQSGEKREKTEWHSIVIFGGLAKIVEKYLKKGSKVYIEGQLQTRKWQKDGVDRYTTEIVLQNFSGNLIMLSGSGDGDNGGDRDDRGGSRQQSSSSSGGGDFGRSSGGGGGGGGFGRGLDDDIPFEMSWR